MTEGEIDKVVQAYFPESKFTTDTIQYAKLACENVERIARQDSASKMFDLANKIHNNTKK